MKNNSNKILATASIGGHWIQLLRLLPIFEKYETVYVSTRPDFSNMVDGKFYSIPDFNRNSLRNLIKAIFQLISIINKEKPSVVISTGAAPGLLSLFLANIYGKKTIWIDSMANVEELSLSGKIASKFCSRVYTQWPNLAKGKVVYFGNVMS